MSLLDRIQELANRESVSIKQIERECGIGNGTIRKWGTQSPSIENVRKVANYLRVPLSYLIDEESNGATNFSKGEEEIFRLIHPLSEIDKIKVAGVIEHYLGIRPQHKSSVRANELGEVFKKSSISQPRK